jgi:thiol-disulfide isomerase/thioredoxin
MKKNIILLFIGIVTTVMLMSCSSEDSTAKIDTSAAAKADARSASTVEQPKTAKTFSAVSAVDVDGNNRAMSEWVGQKPVVINFWGTWCPPCRMEIPGLVQLYDEYKGRGVEIVSLAIERRAGPQEVKAFSEQNSMGWVMLMANDDVKEAFRLGQSVPTTIFFDASGKEVSRHVGARSYQDFKVEFEKIAGS